MPQTCTKHQSSQVYKANVEKLKGATDSFVKTAGHFRTQSSVIHRTGAQDRYGDGRFQHHRQIRPTRHIQNVIQQQQNTHFSPVHMEHSTAHMR